MKDSHHKVTAVGTHKGCFLFVCFFKNTAQGITGTFWIFFLDSQPAILHPGLFFSKKKTFCASNELEVCLDVGILRT